MADQKITELTAETTLNDADIVPFVDDVAGTPITKKFTFTTLKSFLKTYFDTLYNLYVHPNHSGDVTSTGDGATVIANDAVTLAKMAGGTDGNLITYDSNGDPAYVATGTSGQVLTSNGAGAAPTFQDAGGGGAWTLVSYSATTSGISATISSLDLSADFAYKIIYEIESDGSSNQAMLRVNGISTSTYAYVGNRTYWAGSATQELRSSGGNDAWYILGGNANKSYYGEMLLQLVKNGTGGTKRPNISGVCAGFATAANDTHFQNYNFNGFQSSQTNVTSITLGLDGGTNANIKVWVFKPATS